MELTGFKGVEVSLDCQECAAIGKVVSTLEKIVGEMDHQGLEYLEMFSDLDALEVTDIKHMIKVLESLYYGSLLK